MENAHEYGIALNEDAFVPSVIAERGQDAGGDNRKAQCAKLA